MKRINKGLLKRVLAPTLALLLMLTAAPVGQGGVRGNNPKTARLRQESTTMRGTLRAQRIGRSDGLQAGRQDRKRGEPSNFRDEKSYQDATNGYSPKMGDKEHYQQVYRTAFENGYRDGWNGY
ncbi:MAG TPA: hypothetical protein VGC87_15835 [Pyrinomonadaceae bacterium]|jgi:hypothetical protein